jgi:hypothetical protein
MQSFYTIKKKKKFMKKRILEILESISKSMKSISVYLFLLPARKNGTIFYQPAREDAV